MEDFFEWIKVNEGMPIGWEPTPRIGSAQDPLTSAFEKIVRGNKKGQMPFDGNFVDGGVIATTLGLDEEELNALKKSGVLARSQSGVNVDKAKMLSIYKQLRRTSPNVEAPQAPSRMAPPPPPPPIRGV